MGIASIDVLLLFARLVSGTGAPETILARLVDAAVSYLGADGAAVLRITGVGEARVAAAQNAPELDGLAIETDLIGPELASRLLAACGPRFARVHALPLVAEGDLFGV